MGRVESDDEGVMEVGEREFVEGGGIELGCTAHSGSSHFHCVVVLSRALGSDFVGFGVYTTVGTGRVKDEGGDEGL